MNKREIGGKLVELREGRLFVNGVHQFLKIAKPLRNFGSAQDCRILIRDLPILIEKNFCSVALNCYWHHLDPDGDGIPEVSLKPLKQLMDAIEVAGMFCSLSVETYAVGGGQVPMGFWRRFPKAHAVDHLGQSVIDEEYGYHAAGPSLYDADYLNTSRRFMRNLAKGLDASRCLYFETTVEPQYIGNRWIDYSPSARMAYTRWCRERNNPNPEWPEQFPIPLNFRKNRRWNQFRALWLAEWINEDARAIRSAIGDEIWIASDYLDAVEETMIRRCGDPVEFLSHLTEADILQVNWTWHNKTRRPNAKSYRRVNEAQQAVGKSWAITEHMTINGTDYNSREMERLLENTLENGTCFGWEFVDVISDSDPEEVAPGEVPSGAYKPSHFSVYDADWRPIPAMKVVDNRWSEWMEKISKRVAASQVEIAWQNLIGRRHSKAPKPHSSRAHRAGETGSLYE